MRLAALVIVAALARAAHADALDDGLAILDVDPHPEQPIFLGQVLADPLFTVHDTHFEVFERVLQSALRRRGRQTEPTRTASYTFERATVHDAETALPKLLASHPAYAGVLLFKLESVWGKPHVHLWIRMRGGSATDFELDPTDEGLVTLSYWRIGVLAGLGALVLASLVALVRFARRRRRVAPLPKIAYRPDAIERSPRKYEDGIAISATPEPDTRYGATVDARLATDVMPLGAPLDAPRPPPGSIGLLGSVTTPARLRERYRVMAELGRGAMGIVYRAYDENLYREVAVKVITDEMRQHPEAMTLFASEARTLAQLNHPNIVAIYDQIDGHEAMIVMELVDGTTLDRELEKQGRVPWREALRIIDKLCTGLAYAHDKHVIHRDIKPANIFITADRDVKLGDFGLARVMRELAMKSSALRGTPMYMAPEQITGGSFDQRVDLYAVGCTLFELLCGRPVYLEGDPMFQHVNAAAPKVSDTIADIPPAVDALVSSLIAKAADDRPPNANAVRETIATLLATS